MKKEIKAVFIINGKRIEDTERLTDGLVKVFTEYFENNYSEWESVIENFIKENGEI